MRGKKLLASLPVGIWMVLIIAIVAIIGFYIYLQNTRYYIQSSVGGETYKIDRKTGRTWWIYRDEEYLVEPD